MRAVLDIVLIVLDLYVWLLIAAAILSWLIAFNVVNTRNQFVAAVSEFLYRITEPVLRPIRSFIPALGGPALPAGRCDVQDLGAVAQLGERVNGIHEVRGSIPLGSTKEYQ